MIQKSPGPRKPTYRPSRSTTARSHCLAIFGACAARNPRTAPTIAPTGLLVSSVSKRPSASGDKNIRVEMTFTRGPFGAGGAVFVRVNWVKLAMTSFLLIAPAREVVEHLVERKA